MTSHGICYLSSFLFVVICSQQVNAAYECYSCWYSDTISDSQYCGDPSDDETSTNTTCTVGCYALDAVFEYVNIADVPDTTRFVLRGCADPNFAVGGCIRGQQLLSHYQTYIQPYVYLNATGIESGTLCSCAENVCNSGVIWQPTVFLVTMLALCGLFIANA